MRFADLQLLRFGPFDGVTLDFGAPVGFHLIYGSNEAGKSTALRAVLGLLFGIPARTVDNYRFGPTELRIGARLVDEGGRTLEVRRRKGNKNTLLDQEERPLDDDLLQRLVGGVDQPMFEALFALSHARLVEGGEDLLAGKGELGESLYAASGGLRGLHQLRSDLALEADRLFTPAARNKPINQAIAAVADSRAAIKVLQLPAKRWEELDAALRDEQRRLQELEERYQLQDAELGRLERLGRTAALVYEREDRLRRRAALADVRVLPSTAGEERAGLQQKLEGLRFQRRQLEEERHRRREDASRLDVPEQLLALEPVVDGLSQRLGVHNKALEDLPKRRAELSAARAEGEALLVELGRPVTWEDAGGLRVAAPLRALVLSLARRNEALLTTRKTVREELILARTQAERLAAALRALPAQRDVGRLKSLLHDARRGGDLEAQADGAEAHAARLREKALTQAGDLQGWEGDLEHVVRLPLPLVSTVRGFQTESSALARETERVIGNQSRLEQALRRLERELEDVEQAGDLPTESELLEARGQRDQQWSVVRRVWLDGDPLESQSAEGLAEGYEERVRGSDEVSDRLRRHAERVARRADLQRQRARHEEDRAAERQRLAELKVRQTELQDRWREQWRNADVQAGSPDEMVEWLGRHEQVRVAWEECVAAEGQAAKLRAQIEQSIAAVGQELIALGQPDEGEGDSLALLLIRAEQVLERLETVESQRRTLSEKHEDVLLTLARRERDAGVNQKDWEEWGAEWREATSQLGYKADMTTEQAGVILDGLHKLGQKVDEAAALADRIGRIEEDVRAFDRHAHALAERCAPDLVGLEADEVAAHLLARLKAGLKAADERAALERRLAEIEEALLQVGPAEEKANVALAHLLQQAGCATVDDLPEAERRSAEFVAVDSRLRELNEQLQREPLPLDELVAQVLAVDPDRLPALVAECRAQRDAVRDELDTLRVRVGELAAELRALDGNNAAACAAEERQEALAGLQAGVERYVELRLSAVLLAQEIERYRDQHAGPVLRRASEIFERITEGRFRSLRAGFDDRDREVIRCCRQSGVEVDVAGLSDGTRDQLYLALRLAAIDHRLQQGDLALPLIVDDILINFDDGRAEATLALLGELASRTQVLFFTHHRRLVELARQGIPAGRLHEHDLDLLATLGASS